MTTYIALTLAFVVIGQTEKKSKTDEGDPHAGATVYLSRVGYKPEGDREPLTIRINSIGRVIDGAIVDVTEKMLKKWVTTYCKGQAKVVIAIAVEDADKTTLSTISKTIDKIKKYVPDKTKLTLWILE